MRSENKGRGDLARGGRAGRRVQGGRVVGGIWSGFYKRRGADLKFGGFMNEILKFHFGLRAWRAR